jgi:predicted nucleotidyltransferase
VGDNMKTAGIIVEYNPLHNGHLHHIKETRRKSGCDCLVAVMSGNFMQRGEPAMIDKFTRTKMALLNEVDLVIELPFLLTIQSADIFACASVSLLNYLGVDELYFGSESGDVDELYKLSEIINSKEYNKLIKVFLKEGNSYPTSSALAVKKISNSTLYNKPNNILGIHYINAVKNLNSEMKIKTIERIKTNYHDEFTEGTEIQSASAIRKLLKVNKDITNFVPDSVYELLKDRKIIDLEMFYEHLKYKIISSSNKDLEEIFGIKEGLENRIKSIKDFSSIKDLIEKVISRRYTNSKLKRSFTHILCQTKKEILDPIEIPYIRILGMNDTGKSYLNSVKKDLTIPLISKVTENIHPYLDTELKVSMIYSLVSDRDIFKEEFNPIIYMHND